MALLGVKEHIHRIMKMEIPEKPPLYVVRKDRVTPVSSLM